MSPFLTSGLAQAASNSNQGLQVTYYVMLGLGAVLALAMTVIIFFTGKGDAMSGGGTSVRTTFKGKSSFDDHVYTLTFWMGISFMVVMLVCDVLLRNIYK